MTKIVWNLEFEIYLGFGNWDLGFNILHLIYSSYYSLQLLIRFGNCHYLFTYQQL